ncbi:GDSL-type esterase/lipase family protein [Mucilaginibacter xinganensis]|uniref:Lipolytic protein G-D-S-L family n=1 Tax=Mucilaginibacter xinganensis TaxID=1234841 RepID=A0A223NRV3_9SPHI|nr:GDSL-type esterase/lipase family protein [Mucilaginibacter xinganensis]ASU32577.1 lipolytic protein G-D-S-L family [Mucilaginibacter xinganensis]
MITKLKMLLLTTATLLLAIAGTAAQAKRDINIVFIGNSITYGAGLSNPTTEAPPAIAVNYLEQQSSAGKVAFANQGHGGFTTVDFLPSTNRAFKEVEQAARSFTNKQALLIFSIKLGTNDSAVEGPTGAPVFPEVYYQNLKTIADSLLKEFPGSIVIFQHPVWYSPNTYNGAKYLAEGLDRLQNYIPQIDQLVADYAATFPKRVFVGDTKAFDYFKKHATTDLQPENGHAGTFYLHPNKQGAAALGNFWGEAINKVLKKLGK